MRQGALYDDDAMDSFVVMDVPSSGSDSAFHTAYIHQCLFRHITQCAVQGNALARAHFYGGQARSRVAARSLLAAMLFKLSHRL